MAKGTFLAHNVAWAVLGEKMNHRSQASANSNSGAWRFPATAAPSASSLLLWRELIQPSDGACRLPVGCLELLALGVVLVDLAEDLVPLPRSAPDRPLYLYPQEPQFSGSPRRSQPCTPP